MLDNYVFLFIYLELVKNVTSCYLYNLCDLCGAEEERGLCLPANGNGIGKCKCFQNTNDTSQQYVGEFCVLEELPIITSPSSSSSSWTPIIVGILAGLAGLFCAITCCLLAVAAWRRQRRHPDDP